MLLFFLINIVSLLVILKINYLIFNQKMYYPFRIAEINTFIINNILVTIIMSYFFNLKEILLVLFINIMLSWIIYHVANMIQTSPRTKILLDLYDYKTINKADYLKKYTIDDILKYRLQRFNSSNQIDIQNNIVKLTNNKSIVLSFIFYVFKFFKSL